MDWKKRELLLRLQEFTAGTKMKKVRVSLRIIKKRARVTKLPDHQYPTDIASDI